MVEDRKKNLATVRAGTPRKPGNTLFRATRYALNHPAFEGKTLKPGKALVEIQAEREQAQPKPDASLAKAKTDGVRERCLIEYSHFGVAHRKQPNTR
jgi:hypothetical protein